MTLYQGHFTPGAHLAQSGDNGGCASRRLLLASSGETPGVLLNVLQWQRLVQPKTSTVPRVRNPDVYWHGKATRAKCSITNSTFFFLQSRTRSAPVALLDGVYIDPSKHTCYETTREYCLPDSADARPITSCSFRVKSGDTRETPEIFLDNPGPCFY